MQSESPLRKIPECPIDEDITRSRKKRKPKIVAVVNDACTGCTACVPFCPVDCIETLPAGSLSGQVIQPVQIRFDECIGCEICVKVCDRLAWRAIDMVPMADFERETRIVLSENFPAEQAPVYPISSEVREKLNEFIRPH